MKDSPIIMSGAMVRALIEGRKTQTRRIMKAAFGKKHPIVELKEHGVDGLEEYTGRHNDPFSWGYPGAEDGADISLGRWGSTLSPYVHLDKSLNWTFNPLWVRETCVFQWPESCDDGRIYDETTGKFGRPIRRDECDVIYKATDDGKTEWMGEDGQPCSPRWVPSIFMPRFASRLTLELTEVRVERLQDISRTDAAAEGVCLDLDKPLPAWCRRDRWPEENYAALWESLNGTGSWDVNPWVWTLTFRVHQQNIDAFLKAGEATAA